MAITSVDELITGLIAGQRHPWWKNSQTVTALRWVSLWKYAGVPGAGANPLPSGASGAAPSGTTAGAFPLASAGVGEDLYLAQHAWSCDEAGMLTMVDRLVHTSGLSGTSIVTQQVQTVPLTRSTDGKGVECWLECYTQLGATSRTATVTYTNQDGTQGRTGTGTIPATMRVGEVAPVQLQSGDTGVRSVQTLILNASTGTAGDFGVTLLKRLADMTEPVSVNGVEANAFDLGLPEVSEQACLAFLYLANSTTPGPWYGSFCIAKA